MRPVKSALKTARAAGEHPTTSEAAWEPVLRVLEADKHTTPWDEPERDWGRRGDSPVRIFRKTFRREKLLGTW